MNLLDEVLKPLLAAVMTVGVPFVGYVGWQAFALYKRTTGARRTADARASLDYAVINAVHGVEQAMGGTRRRPDGTLDDAAAAEMRETALSGARTYLGDPGFKELMEAFGLDRASLELLIVRRVNAAVFEMKTGASPPPPAAGAPSLSMPARPAKGGS